MLQEHVSSMMRALSSSTKSRGESIVVIATVWRLRDVESRKMDNCNSIVTCQTGRGTIIHSPVWSPAQPYFADLTLSFLRVSPSALERASCLQVAAIARFARVETAVVKSLNHLDIEVMSMHQW